MQVLLEAARQPTQAPRGWGRDGQRITITQILWKLHGNGFWIVNL
jgi:hypothetical protein